jgi:hypothetical protein
VRPQTVRSAAAMVVSRHRAGLDQRAQSFLELELARVAGVGAGAQTSDFAVYLRPGEQAALRAMARRLAPEVESTVRELEAVAR